jgi:hypothetical protein
MTPDEQQRLDEAHANLFCTAAEVREILNRYRKPVAIEAPEYWAAAKRKAYEDWHAGRIPIWRRNPDGTQVFFGYENDPEACQRRDEFDAEQQRAMGRSDRQGGTR